nr:hypothetical protein [Nonomuraea basaltis]
MVTGLIAGVLADRWNARIVALAGALVLIAGLGTLVPLGQDWKGMELVWRLVVVGTGTGLFAGPVQTMAMAMSPRHLLGTTGASTSMARQIGIALGPALATTAWALSGYGAGGTRLAIALTVALAGLGFLALARPAPILPGLATERKTAGP